MPGPRPVPQVVGRVGVRPASQRHRGCFYIFLNIAIVPPGFGTNFNSILSDHLHMSRSSFFNAHKFEKR